MSPSLCLPPPQGEESLQFLGGTEGDSFPLVEINTCEVSLARTLGRGLTPSPCPVPGPPRAWSHTFLLQTEASEQWDYVLVADQCTQRNPRQAHQQQRFLEELSRKGFHHKVGWLRPGAMRGSSDLGGSCGGVWGGGL